MDIKFIKREELQEKPDEKKLGFGKYFTDYMFVMDYDEGIGWHSDGKEVPVYRLYNPNAVTGTHHYTTSVEERDFLDEIGWNYEGIGWYGIAQK